MSLSFGPTVLSQDTHFLLRDPPPSPFPFHPHRHLARERDLLPLPQLANPTSRRPTPSITLFILHLDGSTPPGPSPQSSKCSPGGRGAGVGRDRKTELG